ncbi:DUF262 domain-containing protein [Candidatus Poribacteria bacterium]
MKNLITLQELFENKVFKIPDYQRGYSWESTHRSDLLDDLESMNGKRHYTGTVVLKENGTVPGFGETYLRYDVVDGQQRITTLIILLNEIMKGLDGVDSDESREIAANILKRYLKYKGPQGSIYKLELDQDNDAFFRQRIIDSESAERKIKSHIRIYEAQDQFKGFLKRKKKENKDTYPEYLKDLINLITQDLVFTIYEVEDDAEVGVIFEVMNDRGKPLSQLEKVKNFLIYHTDRISMDDPSRDQMIDQINYSWKQILENLSLAGKAKNEDENQFLRLNYVVNFYSTLSSFKDGAGKMVSINTQLADIHGLVKKRFKSLEKSKKSCYEKMKLYIQSLKDMSFKFRDLVNPYGTKSFSEIEVSDDSIIESLRTVTAQIDRLGIQSNIMALLMAIYNRYADNPNRLLELIKLCEKLVFRVYYIANKRSYTAQSTIYTLANKVNMGRLDHRQLIAEVYAIIEEYCPSESIGQYLADPKEDYYEWNGLRYFLYEYERKRCSEETGKRPAFEWDDLKQMRKEDSVEHILPQTIEDESGKKATYWTSRFKEEEHKKNLKRIGNLTLSTRNSSLGNKPFNKKQKIYKDSRWQIERDIAVDYTEWAEKDIATRVRKLIKFATERWGI